MSGVVCIQLNTRSSNETEERFVNAIAELRKIVEPVFSRKSFRGHVSECSVTMSSEIDSAKHVVCFTLSDSDFLLNFKSVTKLIMERNLIGDKYEVVINPTAT